MNADAALLFGSFNDPLSIKIRSWISQVDGKRRAQCMLGSRIRVRVNSCGLDTIPSSCSPHSSNFDEFEGSRKQLGVYEQGNFTTIGDQN